MQDMISVIVPVYKVEKYLDECVASIVAQTHQNLEIILVDDGSPDQCPVMCERWAEKDSRIRVIHTENSGVSSARNIGLASAKGAYIAFADSDDWLRPDMYEKLLAALEKTGADISACNVLLDSEGRQEPAHLRALEGTAEEIIAGFYRTSAYMVSPWNKLYRCALWQDVRFPVGITCGEDAMAAFQVLTRANKIVQIGDALYIYRIRENSAMTTAFSHKRMDEELAWRRNYELTAEKYPKLQRLACDYYLQKVNMLRQEIPAEKRADFAQEYDALRRILKKNVGYVLFASQLPCKQRVKLALDSIRG